MQLVPLVLLEQLALLEPRVLRVLLARLALLERRVQPVLSVLREQLVLLAPRA